MTRVSEAVSVLQDLIQLCGYRKRRYNSSVSTRFPPSLCATGMKNLLACWTCITRVRNCLTTDAVSDDLYGFEMI